MSHTNAVNPNPEANHNMDYTPVSPDPISKTYWTREIKQWFHEAIEHNRSTYEDYLPYRHERSYRSPAFEFIRSLKTRTEWALLSKVQAHAAATKGLTMLARGTAYEFHPWTMLVADCEIVEVPVESDFLATWLKVSANFGPDVRESAVARAKEQPIRWRKELETRLAPISPLYRLFCDSCMYLQTAIGPDMPMT